jgi:hypothetical protein
MCSGAAVQLVWVLLVCTMASCTGQMQMPFSGAGDKPPAVPTDVFVSTYVERMLSVNDRDYDFQAGALRVLCIAVARTASQAVQGTAGGLPRRQSLGRSVALSVGIIYLYMAP